jgi:hypothetical protein
MGPDLVESVFPDDLTHLLYLIGLGLAIGSRLKIEDLVDLRSGEDVMSTSVALYKPQGYEQRPQVVESHIGVGRARQNLPENFLQSTHETYS